LSSNAATLLGMPEDCASRSAHSAYHGQDGSRGCALAIVGLIFVNRSFSASLITALRRPNQALAWVLLVVAAILAVTLLCPFASDPFHFGPLHLDDLALTIGAGAVVLIALKFLKPLWRARLQGA
jgi:Ca2+-transporting ATPase